MAIYWRDMYNINVSAINNERKLFFSILNQIENNTFIRQRELAKQFIDELLGKLEIVFEQEENLFKMNKCPNNLLITQNQEHGEFLDHLRKINSKNFSATIEFIDILKTFIINHIIGSDLECGVYIKYTYINNLIGLESNNSILTPMVDREILIQWNSYFETGIAEVDKQHFGFVDILNDLALNYNIYTNHTLVNIIDELINYASVHFKTEEAYIERVKEHYPDYEKHKKEHADFTEYLYEKAKIFMETRENGSFEKNEKFLKELIDWLAKHVIGTDKVFAEIYHKFNEDRHS